MFFKGFLGVHRGTGAFTQYSNGMRPFCQTISIVFKEKTMSKPNEIWATQTTVSQNPSTSLKTTVQLQAI